MGVRLEELVSSRAAEIKTYADEIAYVSKLTWAINDAAVLLLESEKTDYTGAMRQGMAMIGQCMDGDRVIVWQNEAGKDGGSGSGAFAPGMRKR